MKLMRSRPRWKRLTVWFGAAFFAGYLVAAGTEQVASGQAADQPPQGQLDSGSKELEPAARKAREGPPEEAVALIKQLAGEQPVRPPARLNLARLLSGADESGQ